MSPLVIVAEGLLHGGGDRRGYWSPPLPVRFAAGRGCRGNSQATAGAAVAEGRPSSPARRIDLQKFPPLGLRRPVGPCPGELRRQERLRGLRIGDLDFHWNARAANSLRRPRRTASTMRRIVERGEERERPLFAVFLAHEHQRHARRHQHSPRPSGWRRAATSVLKRSPAARFPTWSWFCTQTTNRVRSASPMLVPWRRRRNGL